MGFVLRKNAPNDATTTTRTTQKKCQRCFSLEHWTFECLLKPGDQGTYVKRQSKTELLKKRREEEDVGKSNTKGFQEFMKIGKKERREVFRDPRERRARALKRKVDALRGTKKRKKKKKSGRESSSSSSSSSESSGSSSSSSSGSSPSSSSSLSASSSSSSSLSMSSGSSSLSSSGSSSSSS